MLDLSISGVIQHQHGLTECKIEKIDRKKNFSF